MRCDTTPCAALKRTLSVRESASGVAIQPVHSSSLGGRSGRHVANARTSLMTSQKRLSSPLTMKPVRQCARRWMLDIDVAQASPLFSDHAPREVHLWQ